MEVSSQKFLLRQRGTVFREQGLWETAPDAFSTIEESFEASRNGFLGIRSPIK